ncbi:MAG: GFA family protein [Gammaproteobacteria bacterium]|jgi:hypothetical protein|nr:GFA family protein [Gammaproteobacteria bacterium]MBT3724443.1 GFA family protein [Gammaproteobacteria bacterium]MBT4075407.1 GFA family protein [Gammaproteobacteria bacterium]MBT4195613.1 GFA family protein [Gammaproteobacteria bacterium]MBT4450554.1 GFA family protein [Gammaproteobacteria bacterium]
MSDNTESGKCLCGSIKFSAKHVNHHVGACHCSMCRRWGGGPLIAVDCGTDVTFKGEENISIFDSSDWAERGFCKKCGSHLFYRLKQKQQYHIPAGLFDNNEQFIFDHQIFIDKKPAFYSFENKTNNLTEAEVFSKYAPEPE